jgi:hypothetical protein
LRARFWALQKLLNVYNNLVFIESKSFSQRLCGFVILPALLIFFIPGTTVKAKQVRSAGGSKGIVHRGGGGGGRRRDAQYGCHPGGN